MTEEKRKKKLKDFDADLAGAVAEKKSEIEARKGRDLEEQKEKIITAVGNMLGYKITESKITPPPLDYSEVGWVVKLGAIRIMPTWSHGRIHDFKRVFTCSKCNKETYSLRDFRSWEGLVNMMADEDEVTDFNHYCERPKAPEVQTAEEKLIDTLVNLLEERGVNFHQ